MRVQKVSVAEGKQGFSRLLREVADQDTTVLIYRHQDLAGALLGPEAYERLTRLQAYVSALQLSDRLSDLGVDASRLAALAREALDR